MSDERSRLIEAKEDLEKAQRLARRLDKTKEVAGTTFMWIVVAAILGVVGYIIIMPWFLGAGWFTILMLSAIGVFVGWNYLRYRANTAIAEAEKIANGSGWDRHHLDY